MIKTLSAVISMIILLLAQTVMAWADSTAEVKTVFERFIAAQNEYDQATLKELLLDIPNFLWFARGTPMWGRDAALQGLDAARCKGTWYLNPGTGEFKTIELAADIVEIFAPAVFRAVALTPQQQQQFPPEGAIISEIMVNTSRVADSEYLAVSYRPELQ